MDAENESHKISKRVRRGHANIIQNPKYKGCYAGRKVKVIDLYTRKQEFLSEGDWVTFKGGNGETVPALVSEELWEKANAVFRRRSTDVKGLPGTQSRCRRNRPLVHKTGMVQTAAAAHTIPFYFFNQNEAAVCRCQIRHELAKGRTHRKNGWGKDMFGFPIHNMK